MSNGAGPLLPAFPDAVPKGGAGFALGTVWHVPDSVASNGNRSQERALERGAARKLPGESLPAGKRRQRAACEGTEGRREALELSYTALQSGHGKQRTENAAGGDKRA